MRKVGTRLLGVGLAAGLAVVSLGLALTGRLALYINPESNVFVVVMSIVLLAGAVLSFALPLGAEADHGHDHDHGADHPAVERAGGETRRGDDPGSAHHVPSRFARSATDDDRSHDHTHAEPTRPWGVAAAATGGGLAVITVGAMLVLPPASLSAELAMSRDTGVAPLFAGSDVLQLATVGDTASFGVGDWASAFASTTDPAAFDGDQVTLTGFVTPAASGFDLTRLVITHCVIDAQPASVPVTVDGGAPATGEWVTVTGTIRSTSGGALSVVPTAVQAIAQPSDPYEY